MSILNRRFGIAVAVAVLLLSSVAVHAAPVRHSPAPAPASQAPQGVAALHNPLTDFFHRILVDFGLSQDGNGH
jgi:hypothetical protein